MPAIETREQHWVSWDEPLVANRRVHWAISERELFRFMADVSQVADNICTLGEADLQSTHSGITGSTEYTWGNKMSGQFLDFF